MSNDASLVTARHFAYVAERTRGDDILLTGLKAAARLEGIPPIWIEPAQASLMRVLLRLAGAREVVEVGTLAGYSAITMARALPPGGRVRTIELEPRHVAFARSWAARSDVADRVDVLEGSGAEVLATLDGPIDALFLDADKAGYPTYLELARPLLRPGALVMCDNAFAFGQLFDDAPTDREVPAVRAFNDHLAAQDWLDAVIVPVGDGLWVGCVR